METIEIAYIFVPDKTKMRSTYSWENDSTKFMYKNGVDAIGHRYLNLQTGANLFVTIDQTTEVVMEVAHVY